MTKKLEAGSAGKNLKPARLKARTEPHLGVLGQARADLKKKNLKQLAAAFTKATNYFLKEKKNRRKEKKK